MQKLHQENMKNIRESIATCLRCAVRRDVGLVTGPSYMLPGIVLLHNSNVNQGHSIDFSNMEYLLMSDQCTWTKPET